MINREIALAVLGKMPTEDLLKALAVVGGGDQGMDGADPMAALAMDGGDNKIQAWGDRKIPYNGGSDRPGIADKKWAEGSGEMNAMDPREGQMDDGVDPTNIFLQTGGGV